MTGEPVDLRVRTKALALRIIRLSAELPRTMAGQVIGKQVLRSGTSVGANYREAFRARSHAEFISKCGDALREIDETGYWLELLEESGVVKQGKLESLRHECDELIAIFVAIVKKAKERRDEKP